VGSGGGGDNAGRLAFIAEIEKEKVHNNDSF